jgi:starch-binding outer membrane protein, SusD/RagB family
MKIKSILIAGLSLMSLGVYTSCEDMMDTNSSLVMFSQDNNLNSATDTVYSVMGIIGKMQSIADQTVLLGEIRGDLVELTPQATVGLQELAEFNAGKSNVYASATNYYAVINNCNFYLANVDTALRKRNEYVFMREFAAVKTFRAWTYLQLAMIYGTVPFITDPILTEASANKEYPMYNVKQLCDYFVNDLTPYVNTSFPSYGAINGLDSKKFFLPTRVVLGDLCLWAERYAEAATFYHDYLTAENNVVTTGLTQTSWNNESTSFTELNNGYGSLFSTPGNAEIVSYIPMESTASDPCYSGLREVFNSTLGNNYYFQATPSHKLIELSKAQSNCIVFSNTASRDTLFAPLINDEKPFWVGDLRLASMYSTANTSVGSSDGNSTTNSTYSSSRQTINKFSTGHVILYRRGQIYLRYAEAMNRAGFIQSAFAVLKYGLYPSNITKYILPGERSAAGNLLTFSQYAFNAYNTLGIHSRGSGDAAANKQYVLPYFYEHTDSVNFVEDLICNETALETSFEGCRYFDLLRMALHRDDTNWLATKIAGRRGASDFDALLFAKLSSRENWYLPLK